MLLSNDQTELSAFLPSDCKALAEVLVTAPQARCEDTEVLRVCAQRGQID